MQLLGRKQGLGMALCELLAFRNPLESKFDQKQLCADLGD